MKKVSEKSLSNAALFYLRRFSATRKGLVRVLEQKARRALRDKSGEPGELDQAKVMIEAVVAKLVKDGFVDDARAAESKTASLHRQGKSSRVIELKLREKGIEPALAKKSAISTPERELEAACTLVKRKRLGVDPERKQKDAAVLMRAGFNRDVAARALATVVQLAPEVPATPWAVLPSAASRLSRTSLPTFPSPLLERGLAGDESTEECRVLQFPTQYQPELPKTDSDLEAASELVKKKRLGIDPERKQRDLAVLVRAGFRFEVAKRALDAREEL